MVGGGRGVERTFGFLLFGFKERLRHRAITGVASFRTAQDITGPYMRYECFEFAMLKVDISYTQRS